MVDKVIDLEAHKQERFIDSFINGVINKMAKKGYSRLTELKDDSEGKCSNLRPKRKNDIV